MLPIRILLASSQPIIRSGLRQLLEQESDFEVVAEAANGREALVLADYKQPDIALLEITLPLVSGVAVARQLSERLRAPRVVFVTSHIDETYVHEAFRASACGYVDADQSSSDLRQAIRVVGSGRLFLSPAVTRQLLKELVTRGNMSELERDLCVLIAAGHDENEIAALLNADLELLRKTAYLHEDAIFGAVLPSSFARELTRTFPRIAGDVLRRSTYS